MPLHIPTVTVAPPKVFWAPMISHRYTSGKDIHPAELTQPQMASATCKIPPDFTTLDHLYLVMYPEGTGNFSVVVNIWFGEDGQTPGNHSQGQGLIIPMTNNRLKSYDLVPDFAALIANMVAGDHLQIIIVYQSVTDVHFYGLDGRYS